MIVIRDKHVLSELKALLDSGVLQPVKEILPCLGLLQSVLEGLWSYDAVVDQWPGIPKAVVFRPIQTTALPYINRCVYVIASDTSVLRDIMHAALPWNKPLTFARLPTAFGSVVRELSTKHAGEMVELYPPDYCYVENGKLSSVEFSIPKGLTLQNLRQKDIPEVLAHIYQDIAHTYPKEWRSSEEVEYVIRQMPSFAFIDERGRPVAWTTVDLTGTGGRSYTSPAYRSQKLFIIGSKYLEEELHKRGRPFLYAYVEPSNKNPGRALGGFYDRVGDLVLYLRHQPKITEHVHKSNL